MPPRAPRRQRGRHYEEGKIKRKILLHVFNYPNGIEEWGIRDYLRETFGIGERTSVVAHLSDLAEKGYLIKKNPQGSGGSNYWYPTTDITIFRNLWKDSPSLIRIHDDIDEKLALLSTEQGKIFLQNKIVPAFIDSPDPKILKGTKLFFYLPSKTTSENEQKEFREIGMWACESCPTLISHLFFPDKQILLGISMILLNNLKIEDPESFSSKVIQFPEQTLPKNYMQIIQKLQDNWKSIRFSDEVSKEMVSTLTILTCLFAYAEQYPEKATMLFESKNFLRLWRLFMSDMDILTGSDKSAITDAVKMMFITTFAKKIFV